MRARYAGARLRVEQVAGVAEARADRRRLDADPLDAVDEVERVVLGSGLAHELGQVAQSLAVRQPDGRCHRPKRPTTCL